MGTISRTGITGGGTIQSTHVTNIIDALDGTSTTTTVIATGSFSGSLVGALTGTASFATNALTASFASNVPTTSSYALSALSSSYAVTASFATTALSASYAANVPLTASYALSALSSSYAVTASFALNAGGGTGVGFPFTGSAQVTGSMGITGSLAVSGSLRIGTAYNQNALLVTGSTFTSGSFIGFAGQLDMNTNLTADKNGIINLAGLGGSGFTGKFVLPNARPDQPVAGSIYWDDATEYLYVYNANNGQWVGVQLT